MLYPFSRRLLLAFSGSLLLGAGAPTTVQLEITSSVDPARLASALMVARSPSSPEPHLLGRPRNGTFALPAEGLWTLTVEGQGIWAVPIEIRAPGAAQIRIEPGASMRARLVPPDKQPLPRAATLQATRCKAEEALPELPCPVDAAGVVTCAVPSGCIDLRLKVRGFASHYFWERRAESDSAQLDLGTLPLTPGASVSGWVATEDGRPLADDLQVQLQLQGVTSGPEPLTKRIQRTAVNVRPDRRGFFQFADVAPGDYELAATQAGYGTARVPLVHVREGLETPLPDPVILSRPRTAAFQVTPPTSPSGGAWSLQLAHHRPAGVELIDTAPLDPTGYLTFDGLVPGKYGVKLLDAASGRPIDFRQIEITAPFELFSIDVDLIPITGTVTLGDNPLPESNVVFGGRTGATQVALVTDEDGRFRGALPKAGRWAVDISSDVLHVRRNLADVEVRVRSGQDAAIIDIELEDGRISGAVVDEEFHPQPRALVELRPAGPEEAPVAIKAGEDGRFQLRGLPEGPATIRAATEDAESDSAQVQLSEVEGDEIQIVVRQKRIVHGFVVDRSGVVAAANLSLREYGGVLERGTGTVTEADGSFEVSLPREISAVHLWVAAPGRTYWVGRRSLGDEPMTIELAREGGTVELLYPPDRWASVHLLHDGGSGWFVPVGSWAALHESLGGLRDFASGRLVVPQLAPGEWDACLVEPGSAAWLRVAIFGQPLGEACVHFRSSAGETATADLRGIAE